MFKEVTIGCLGTILYLILTILVNGLVFWGLGSLIIYVFNIDYNYTYFQAVIVGTVWAILKIVTIGGRE